MKRRILFSLFTAICLGCLALGWTIHLAAPPPAAPLSQFVPAGALLYLQADDFSTLLAQWNASAEKKHWLEGDNYEMFSRSRLFLRLKGASDQFATAAGLPADMKFLTELAGKQSAVALYDIGKLQFLYITRIEPSSAMRSGLWQTRSKFETRNVAGINFYLRRDPESEREVAFATAGDYLLLATREDLMAGALQLIADSKDQTKTQSNKDRTIESEPWWSQSISAANHTGDLRMVLDLKKIVPSSYFRTYWVQQNVTEMKQYSAAVVDMFLSGHEYREERVLLRESPSNENFSESSGAVATLAAFAPEDVGFYEAKANPSPDAASALLETKLLTPHASMVGASLIAPQVQLTTGETGGGSDLETRIDQAPAQSTNTGRSTEIKSLLEKHRVLAMAKMQSTERDQDGVFVKIHTAIAFASNSDWSEAEIHAALANSIRSSLTASELGVNWQPQAGYSVLDGLWPFCVAVRGKYLIVADDPRLLSGILSRTNQNVEIKPETKSATFIAEFRHDRERENFARLTELVDRPRKQLNSDRTPQFVSGNIASLSSALSGVSTEHIAVRDAGDKVLETVTYQWSQ
jgi:hypothetical protein